MVENLNGGSDYQKKRQTMEGGKQIGASETKKDYDDAYRKNQKKMNTTS